MTRDIIDIQDFTILDGRNASTTNTIEKVLGRPAKSFSTFAKEIATTGVWDVAIPETAE